MTGQFELSRAIRAEVGDALRMAGVYAETEFDHLYLRDDVASEYAPAEIETLRREIIVSGLGREKLEDVVHAGELRRIVYETEDAFAIHVPAEGHAGAFVSIERCEPTRLFAVADAVEEWIAQRKLPPEDGTDR